MDQDIDETMEQLDLSLIDSNYIDQAIGYWKEKNPLGILCLFSNEYGLEFVIQNMGSLLEHGIYEETLLNAFIGARTNWANYPIDYLHKLFKIGDRNRFLQAGDPLPHRGPFTLYRGIAGAKDFRRERGISWTSSLEMAKWYAGRFTNFLKLENPAVFEAIVDEEFVYTYTNERNENEFLCYIPDSLRLKIVWP
jgi:hypothetical protein